MQTDKWQVWFRQEDNSWFLLAAFPKRQTAQDFHMGVENAGFRAAIRFVPGLA